MVAEQWYPLQSGGRVAVFRDSETGLWARADYDTNEAFARAQGGELLTKEQFDEIARTGFFTRPVTLVQTASDSARMATREFAERHDAGVRAQLVGYDGTRPIVMGKVWLKGAPPGKSLNYGFWDGKKMIQSPGRAHDRRHVDYSQLVWVWMPS